VYELLYGHGDCLRVYMRNGVAVLILLSMVFFGGGRGNMALPFPFVHSWLCHLGMLQFVGYWVDGCAQACRGFSLLIVQLQ